MLKEILGALTGKSRHSKAGKEYRAKYFDPEGSGFDYTTAVASGDKPNKTGHWGSIDPHTGMVLKGATHKTFYKTVEAEKLRGNKVVKKKDGRYYSVPVEKKKVKYKRSKHKVEAKYKRNSKTGG